LTGNLTVQDKKKKKKRDRESGILLIGGSRKKEKKPWKIVGMHSLGICEFFIGSLGV
jgi:hypothetical protein